MAQLRHSKKQNRSGSTKKQKMTIGRWKKKLWVVFAKFIKERDGYVCFTCGRPVEGKNAHAGHFIPKSVCGLGLYFSELNVHAQCFHCNINLGGNGAEYYVRMVEKYGQEVVDDLMEQKRNKITKELNWEELWERYNNHTSR